MSAVTARTPPAASAPRAAVPRKARPAARLYAGALQACALLEPPMGAAAFVLLTTLLRPHELVRGSTTVLDGTLHVAQGPAHDGPVLGRAVPLSGFTASVLAGGEGHLPELLCLPSSQPGLFLAELATSLEAARDATTDPLVARHLQLHRLLPLALNGLLAAVRGPSGRAAVMAYGGVAPLGRRATRDREQQDERDLRSVADLVDELVADAGYAVSAAPAAASA